MKKEDVIEIIKKKGRFNNVTSTESVEFRRFASEIMDCEKDGGLYYSFQKLLSEGEVFPKNNMNSYLLYLLGIVDTICDFNKPVNYFGEDWYPTRFSAPDIDMDFENNRAVQERAEEVFGDKFIYIGTFNQWAPKQSLQNASKYNNFALPGKTIAETAIELSKAVSRFPKDDSFESYIDTEQFHILRSQHPEIEKIIEDAKKICYQKSSTGKHAGGVIICDIPVKEICPYFVVEETIGQKKTGRWIRVSQFNDKDCEALGLLKADFLGVRNLESIHLSLDLIKSRTGKELDLESIDVFDKEQNDKVLDLFRNGITGGIFQFEGEKITQFMKEMQPTTFNDLVAGNALYRPGPKDNGYTTEYCLRKKNPHLSNPPHESLRELLKDTYGLWVYQEQLMKGSQIIAGFTATESDEFRRIVGKKDLKKLAYMKEKFINRAIDHGVVDKNTAEIIWDQLEKFGNYAFNRSHAAAYTVISYHTAFLKRFFPVEFFAGIMSRELSQSSSAEDENSNIKIYEMEAQKYFGIKLLEPNVNYSKKFYNIEYIDGLPYLRKPLSYLTGIGDKLEIEIVTNQPYSSFEEFYTKNSKSLNTATMETLINNNTLENFGDKDFIKSEYNRCRSILESSKKGNATVKKYLPRMNGLLEG